MPPKKYSDYLNKESKLEKNKKASLKDIAAEAMDKLLNHLMIPSLTP